MAKKGLYDKEDGKGLLTLEGNVSDAIIDHIKNNPPENKNEEYDLKNLYQVLPDNVQNNLIEKGIRIYIS